MNIKKLFALKHKVAGIGALMACTLGTAPRDVGDIVAGGIGGLGVAKGGQAALDAIDGAAQTQNNNTGAVLQNVSGQIVGGKAAPIRGSSGTQSL